MRIFFFVFTLCSLFLNLGCSPSNTDNSEYLQPSWQTISAEEANRMMTQLDSYVLLDVRTTEEFQELRIDGATLIPHNELINRAEEELPDKNAIIFLYCRSGNRSAVAADMLVSLGYTAVYDFGGIISWPYETISG